MNNTTLPNLILNGVSIDINVNHKLTNEYKDEHINTIISQINSIKDTISHLLDDVESENKSEDKYRLRNRTVASSTMASVKSNIINNYITYQSKMLEYFTRLDYLKSNCIRNMDYFIDWYDDTKKQLNLLQTEHHQLKVDFAKANTNHIHNENKLNSHCIEQSIKVTALIQELSDVKTQRDFLKGITIKNKETIIELELKNQESSKELEMKNLDTIHNKHEIDNYEYEIQKILDERKYIIANNVLLRGEFNLLENKWKETTNNLEIEKSKTENLHSEIDKLQKYIYKQNQENIKNITEMNQIIQHMENDKNKIIAQAIELAPDHNWDERYGFISKEYEVIS